MKRMKWLIYLTLYLTLALSIAFLPGSCDRAEGKLDARYPYERLLVGDEEARVHTVDVVLNLKELIKQHGDDSRLLRYVDEDARVVVYLTLNSTGNIFTSMQIVTRGELSPHSPLFRRMGW